jgi:YidC/Oxa1 family membrane protein insertase
MTTYRFSLYAGRRRNLLMTEAGIGALDEPGIGAKAMVVVIQFINILYRYTGNYGWAIILFTLLTRLVLFPLMRKQYHSMAKMQRIQPKLKKIQERYKDNKQEMQQRVLEIYKKEGVNPMGGCLPMIIQLPIIFVIWRAMLYASEQIHLSPGFLWIPDLSQYDPYFVLVIVTTLAMMVQQKFMTPMTQTDTPGFQKYLGYLFPLLMAFLLWRFPAGLWLYYLLTTVAQVGQQYFVNWEMARAGGGTMTLSLDDDDVIDEAEEEDEGDGEVDAADGD